MKSIKEKQLLVKWYRAMNEPVDPALAEEVDRYEQLQKEIVSSVRENTIRDLVEASVSKKPDSVIINVYPKPPTLEELLETIKPVEPEEKITVQPDLIAKTVEHITKEVKFEEQTSYQQPDAPLTSKSIDDLKRKIKFLEDWISKISLTGPGGGAGDVITLDHPVKLVTGDYTLTRHDHYIGVNAAAVVNITVPNSIAFPGRRIIIKDESGHCSRFPIIVSGDVDNDPGGFILSIDNGAIQMIYRQGWRIV